MNTNVRIRNDRLRKEMEVNPILRTLIAEHHIIQFVAIIICVAVSINSPLFYIILLVIVPIGIFIIFCVASKCNFQDLVVILVHFNPILSTMWFLSVFPVFVINNVLYTVTSVAVITSTLSLSSAIFAVIGIWKSARRIILNARSGDRDPGNVTAPCEASVTFINQDCIPIAQASYGQPVLTQ